MSSEIEVVDEVQESIDRDAATGNGIGTTEEGLYEESLRDDVFQILQQARRIEPIRVQLNEISQINEPFFVGVHFHNPTTRSCCRH
ncbi:hypothetical protein LXL04_007897 [Taraxacum kok-saghyz]